MKRIEKIARSSTETKRNLPPCPAMPSRGGTYPQVLTRPPATPAPAPPGNEDGWAGPGDVSSDNPTRNIPEERSCRIYPRTYYRGELLGRRYPVPGTHPNRNITGLFILHLVPWLAYTGWQLGSYLLGTKRRNAN